MELRIQWFGMGWAISVLVAALAAGFLVLLARRYGKGMVIVCGDNIAIPASSLLDDFLAYAGGDVPGHEF